MGHLQVPYVIQTVRNVTTSREIGVQYTNTTTKNLHLLISVTTIGNATVFVEYPAGAIQGSVGATAGVIYHQITGIIPPGKTYSVSKFTDFGASVILNYWIEEY